MPLFSLGGGPWRLVDFRYVAKESGKVNHGRGHFETVETVHGRLQSRSTDDGDVQRGRTPQCHKLDRVDGEHEGAHGAREVSLHRVPGPVEVAVAQRFGDGAMFVHDRRHALCVAGHRFADHSHETVAQ